MSFEDHLSEHEKIVVDYGDVGESFNKKFIARKEIMANLNNWILLSTRDVPGKCGVCRNQVYSFFRKGMELLCWDCMKKHILG